MRFRTIVLVAPALIGAGLIAACNDPESRSPTFPSAPLLTSVSISGPATVAPGQSVQLVANVRMTDGTVKAVSGPGVTWSLIDAGVLQLSQTGLLTAGQQGGEAVIAVSVAVEKVTRTASRTQLVLPNGTFRVVGSVREDEFPNLPVGGARVEVTSGDPSTVTDGNGQYRLYGVPATADIQVVGNGYAPQSRHVTLSANSTQNFVLHLDGPRVGLSGNFTLAIDVTGTCSGPQSLAAGLRHRTYDASVTQNGAELDVLLTESRFKVNPLGLGNRFSGRALGGGATFTLDWFDPYYYAYYGPDWYPDLAEALPDGTYLSLSGNAVVSAAPPGFAGTIANAVLVQWDSRFPAGNTNLIGYCSGTFQFVLTPK
jgi:hypothetical protein